MRRQLLFFIFWVLLASWSSHSQEKNEHELLTEFGQGPIVKKFDRADFKADAQFWTAAEDDEGIMYFGNNDGVLVFNGTDWQKVVLPNSSSVRSLIHASDDTVYAGGYNDLGVIEKRQDGTYTFSSLKEKLGLAGTDFENVWQASRIGDKIIFRTFRFLLIYDGQNLTKVPAANTFLKSSVIDNRFFVNDAGLGIFELDLKTLQLKQVVSARDFDNERIVDIFKAGTHPFLLTTSGKLYKTTLDDTPTTFIKDIFPGSSDQGIHMIAQGDNRFLIGTLSSGVMQLQPQEDSFKVSTLPHLPNKTVLNLYKTSNGNVWALFDNGLALLDYNNPRTVLFEDASVYDVLIINKKIYIATNQGVYVSKVTQDNASLDFLRIPGLEGQAWTLNQFDGDILVGHDKGIFQIRDGTVKKIGQPNGFWKVIKATPTAYLACSYDGLYKLTRNDKTWTLGNKIRGFDESSRDILAAEAHNTFWICHGYKGIYRVTLDESLSRATAIDHFTDNNGLPSPFNINVFKYDGHTVFTTNAGIYTFDESSKGFTPFTPLNTILDTARNTRKIVDRDSRTWVIEDDEVAYFTKAASTPMVVSDPFLETKGTFNRGMETIYPVNENQVIFGTHSGLYLYKTQVNTSSGMVKTTFNQITYTTQDSTYFLPLSAKDTLVELPENTTSVRFAFAAPQMPNSLPNQFRFKLENVENNFSEWQSLNFKEYNLLTPGNYTFKVRGKNALGIASREASYSFRILPPWYKTGVAYVVYVVFGILAAAIMVRWVKRKIEKENEKTKQQEQRANRLLKLELEQLRLERDKAQIKEDKEHLEQDILKKSKELANYTMHLVNKSQLFENIEEELKDLRSSLKTKGNRQKVLGIFQKLRQHKVDEEYMKVFDENFENIHQKFFINLEQELPGMSPRDRRLAAFIKMGLTNKEIAPLLNISVRGVETARYRMRQKLNLEHDENLMTFLENLSDTRAPLI